jgi:hypothetical protein
MVNPLATDLPLLFTITLVGITADLSFDRTGASTSSVG